MLPSTTPPGIHHTWLFHPLAPLSPLPSLQVPSLTRLHLGTPGCHSREAGPGLGCSWGSWQGHRASGCPSVPAPPHRALLFLLPLLPPAVREVHAQKDCLILTQTFSGGNDQQVAEPGGPSRLQLGCLGKMGRKKPGVAVAQGTCFPHPHPTHIWVWSRPPPVPSVPTPPSADTRSVVTV